MIREVNLTAVNQLGVDRDRLIHEPFQFFIKVEDRDCFRLCLRRVFQEPGPRHCEIKLRRPDGKYFFARLDSVAVIDGSGERMCRTSITDISELKQAEQKLQESERLFAAFMAHLPSLAVIRDLEGRCLFANAAWERAFQKSREKWWGETTDDLWPPEIPAKFKQPDQLVMKTGEALHTLGPLPHPDGLHHWISKRFPIVDQDRQPVIIGINAIDVTGQLATQTLLERFLASSPAAIYACEVTGIFAPTYISITSRDWWVGTPWSGPKSSFRAACGRHDWRAQRPLHAWRRLHLAGTGAQARSLRYQKWQAGGLPYQTLNNL